MNKLYHLQKKNKPSEWFTKGKWTTQAKFIDEHFANECCFYMNPLIEERFRVKTVREHDGRPSRTSVLFDRFRWVVMGMWAYKLLAILLEIGG